MNDYIIRNGEKEDLKEVLSMITELAKFERAEDQVQTTLTQLEEDGFGDNKAFEFLIVKKEDVYCGFALYYSGYSTWKGATLYLEDFMIREKFRNQGLGSLLFKEIVNIAIKNKVKRLDWQVLEWNKSAINFYNKQKASLENQWLNGRLYEKDLKEINNESI